MKRCQLVLGLIVICPLLVFGQAKPSKRPTEWSLSLKTGGAPWEKKFEVELNQSGELLVAEQNPQEAQGKQTWKTKMTLKAEDSLEIYEQVLKAFREFRFDDEEIQLSDGTNLTLTLKTFDRELTMQFFHIGQVEEENTHVAKVLSLINKHLPQGHQVF